MVPHKLETRRTCGWYLTTWDRGGRDGKNDQEGLWCQQAPDCVCWDGREGVCDQEAVWFLASGTVWRPSWAEVCWSIAVCAQLLAKGQSLRSHRYSITLLSFSKSLYPRCFSLSKCINGTRQDVKEIMCDIVCHNYLV